MTAFYSSTSVLIITALLVAACLLIAAPKSKGDGLLVAFVLSLVSNTVWSLAGPIAAGIDGGAAIAAIGDPVSRLVAVAGYVCLVLFAIQRRRRS